ncbi:MAG: hypothetical protein D6805_02345 [Planctomycetota bacterium]|nr:MAG: hypothetical protein D6805_02345 [Planctomycetota bacterium]
MKVIVMFFLWAPISVVSFGGFWVKQKKLCVLCLREYLRGNHCSVDSWPLFEVSRKEYRWIRLQQKRLLRSSKQSVFWKVVQLHEQRLRRASSMVIRFSLYAAKYRMARRLWSADPALAGTFLTSILLREKKHSHSISKSFCRRIARTLVRLWLEQARYQKDPNQAAEYWAKIVFPLSFSAKWIQGEGEYREAAFQLARYYILRGEILLDKGIRTGDFLSCYRAKVQWEYAELIARKLSSLPRFQRLLDFLEAGSWYFTIEALHHYRRYRDLLPLIRRTRQKLLRSSPSFLNVERSAFYRRILSIEREISP